MEKTIEIMGKILAESFVVGLKTKNYHWNMSGVVAFYGLHKMLEAQYEELDEAVDTLAERIRQLGALAPATMREYLALSEIKEGKASFSAEEMVRDLADDLGRLMDRLNEGIGVANSCGDEGTVDVLVERLRVHDKSKWMLESSCV